MHAHQVNSASQFQQSYALQGQKNDEEKPSPKPQGNKGEAKATDKVDISSEAKSAAGDELTEEEKKVVEELKKVDREVRAHEQAHMSAGGQYVSGSASFEYQQGPDNQRYAVGGEVQIDTSEISGDPTATKLKMQQVRRAALAPANPSPQDLKVAAQASQAAMQAAAEEMEVKRQEMQGGEAKAPGKGEAPPQTGQEKPSAESSGQPAEKEEGTSSFLKNFAANSYGETSESSQIYSMAAQGRGFSLFA